MASEQVRFEVVFLTQLVVSIAFGHSGRRFDAVAINGVAFAQKGGT
jgi:hypothetical protein